MIVTGREAFGEGAGGIKSRGSLSVGTTGGFHIFTGGGLLNARYDEHVKSNVAIMAASAVRKSRCLPLRERKFRWIAVESISCVLCFELQVK